LKLFNRPAQDLLRLGLHQISRRAILLVKQISRVSDLMVMIVIEISLATRGISKGLGVKKRGRIGLQEIRCWHGV
jgi:hypothetical protein